MIEIAAVLVNLRQMLHTF